MKLKWSLIHLFSLLFSYRWCAVRLFFHVCSAKDRNPRQDVTVFTSTVQLLHTKNKDTLVHTPNKDISTRGNPALTSMTWIRGKIINQLKRVYAV